MSAEVCQHCEKSRPDVGPWGDGERVCINCKAVAAAAKKVDDQIREWRAKREARLPTLVKQLKLTATCSIPLRVEREVKPCDLPCTPHEGGLCVTLIPWTDTFYLSVTHVSSGFAIENGEDGSYPATKVGMAAARHELGLLLPLTDWTKDGTTFDSVAVDAQVVVHRCRAAFPGKLLAGGEKRDDAKPPREFVKWRVYSQDTATGEWSFVDLAHEDHLQDAVDKALTMFDGPDDPRGRRDVPCDSPLDHVNATLPHIAFDFDRSLHAFTAADGTRIVIVKPDAHGFDLLCEQRVEMLAAFAQAQRDLAGVDNPRKTLGVWKSGPKFGAVKLPAKLPPAQCIEVLAQQDRYDAQARKVEQMRADLRHLELYIAESDPLPSRVTKLCPRETPDGKDEAVKLRTFLQAQPDSASRLMFGKCIEQLDANLRAYESVELHGFAPGSKCIVVADPRDDEVDWLATVTDVVVAEKQRTWGEEIWWHERVVVDAKTGEEMTLMVQRLKAVDR